MKVRIQIGFCLSESMHTWGVLCVVAINCLWKHVNISGPCLCSRVSSCVYTGPYQLTWLSKINLHCCFSLWALQGQHVHSVKVGFWFMDYKHSCLWTFKHRLLVMEKWEKAKPDLQIQVQFVGCRRNVWGEILNPLSYAIGFSGATLRFVCCFKDNQGTESPGFYFSQ